MISIVLIVVVLVLLYLVLHKITHSIFVVKIAFRLISIAFALIFILIIASTFFILNDANNFRKNFSNSSNLFLLENNDTLITGVILDNSGGKPYSSIPADAMSAIQKKFDTNTLNDLTVQYYKIFVVDIKTFDMLPSYRLVDRNINLTKDEVHKILLSDNAKQEFAAISATQRHETNEQALSELSGIDDPEIKNYIFSFSISYIFNPRNIDVFLFEVKNNDIRVYKNTAMFQAIRLIPNFLVKDILNTRSNSSITGMSQNSTLTNLLGTG